MEIILLQKVANLGQIGDRVKVKSGYARNFLVPTGRATLATAANIAKFEAQRAVLESRAASGAFLAIRAAISSATSTLSSRTALRPISPKRPSRPASRLRAAKCACRQGPSVP